MVVYRCHYERSQTNVLPSDTYLSCNQSNPPSTPDIQETNACMHVISSPHQCSLKPLTGDCEAK
jgi:hypothetical protein